MGIIIWDELGHLVATRSIRFDFVFGPLYMEALAVCEGVFLAMEKDLIDVLF